jgi:hypothetical protein
MIDAAFAYLDAFNGRDGSLRPLEVINRLAPEMASCLVERLRIGCYRSDLAVELLDLLIANSPRRLALDTVRALTDATDPQLAAAATQHLAALDPTPVVDGLAADPPDSVTLARVLPRLDVTALDEQRLTTATRLLLDAYPFAHDPPLHEDHFNAPQYGARQFRGRLLQDLVARGSVNALDALLEDRADIDRQVIGHYRTHARRRQADLDQRATTPRQLLDLLGRGDARLVRDAATLLQVVVRQLELLQDDIRRNNAFRDLWNEPRQGDPTPKGEDDISDWIRRWLNERLNGGLLVDREVQVARPHGGGVGTRIDLTLTSTTDRGTLARVLIEAKRVDNRELLAAMNDQLVDRYLVPMNRHHGIFLVYWINPDQRRDNGPRGAASDECTLLAQLNEQARAAGAAGVQVVPFVLDISRPRRP